MNTFVASWVPPDHNIVGVVVRHGEAFSITEKLTVLESGKAIYRPTVHYALLPLRLRHRLAPRAARLRLQATTAHPHMTDEIISGADILGALVMGHPYRSWWCGSDLDIEESRRLVPHQNATSIHPSLNSSQPHKYYLYGHC